MDGGLSKAGASASPERTSPVTTPSGIIIFLRGKESYGDKTEGFCAIATNQSGDPE